MLPLLAVALLAIPLPSAAQDVELEAKYKELERILASGEEESAALPLIEDFVALWREDRDRVAEIEASVAAGEQLGDPGAQREVRGELRGLAIEMNDLADAVQSPLLHPRRKKVTPPNQMLWLVAAETLGGMEEFGAARLWEAFEERRFDDLIELRGEFLVQLGRTRSLKFVPELFDLLDHHDHLLIAKAAEALAQYGEGPGRMRRDGVEKLAKLLAEYYEAVQSAELAMAQPGPPNPGAVREQQRARERYDKVAPSMIKALEALSGTTQEEPLEWRRWFNKHKRDKDVWGDI